ncbi:hypothetical protein BOH66_13800 [Microbacterium aurum]|uniref:D-inositol 3-phosphate glycosyltransferase n=1 Tax=Microbacterium aurum TaxID=36805 RepID=A0A1P8UAQ5_9MICO|nr:glycosyltransferase [Microbacterium aurum]APZ35199.1 hypothetical protein BOH66_13800 [Microbacterium aurum]
MRVLRIAHHGVVSAWRERERALRARGLDVRLLSAQRWNEGGRALALRSDGDTFVTGAGTLGSHPNAFVYSPRRIWRALGSCPDIVDLHEEPFALATAEILLMRLLRRRRAPYVVYSAQNIDKRYPIPFRWFERWALRGAAAAYVCNREAGEILMRKGLSGPVRLIPLGVDTGVFAPADRPPPAAALTVGYVGRLDAHKGVDVLLHAAALRTTWQVEITGDGPRRTELVALAAALGISDRVRFLGFAAGDALAGHYRRLDVLAVPSLPRPGWLEQFCRVAVEAMASGVPVVGSRSGAIPDVVADAGILVAPGDATALAVAVDEAGAPERWAQLRARGLTRAERYTWQSVAEMQHALYDEILPARSAGARQRPQVVAVAYGDPALLEGALEALGEGFETTIVDNSSSMTTSQMAERHGIHYIDPGANLGFGAGVNVALRSLRERGREADDVLLLNPDARIAGIEVDRMHEKLHSRRDLAAVGATQIEPATGDPVRVWWPFPGPGRAWLEAVGAGFLNRTQGFVIGSVLLLRAEALAAVGEFDERFFLYAEEVDWQKRATDAGWRIGLAEVAATHIGAATSGDSDRRDALFFASNEIYQRKHFGAPGWQAFRAAMVFGAVVRTVALCGERRAQARRRLAIFVRGPVAHARRVT